MTEQGKKLWPPPQITDPSPPAAAKPAAAAAAKVEEAPPNYFKDTLNTSLMYTAGLGGVLGQLFSELLIYYDHVFEAVLNEAKEEL